MSLYWDLENTFHRLTTSYAFQTVMIPSAVYVVLFPFVSDSYFGLINVGQKEETCKPLALSSLLHFTVASGNIDCDGYVAVTYSMWSCTKQMEGKLQLTTQHLSVNFTSANFCKNCEPLFSGLPKMASSSQTQRIELSTVYHNVAFLAICKRT